MICKFNSGVDCENCTCGTCGWNPDVAQKRIEDWKKSKESV